MIRIVELHIDGFGAFCDFSMELAPGLNVIVGMNEAGKSTLLHFVRRIFYGFPDGRSNANPYPPLAGGRHGGRAVLEVTYPGSAPTGDSQAENEPRRIVLERYAEGRRLHFYDSSGNQLPVHQTHSALFGAVPATVYQSIFGFGLDELQDLASLQQDQIQATIYGVAAGVDPQALAALQKMLGQLDSRGKGKPRRILDDLHKELAAVENAIRRSSDVVAEYDALEAQVEALTQTIDATAAQQAELEAHVLRLERRLRRLEEVNERIAAHRATVNELGPRLGAKYREMAAMTINENVLREAASIERMELNRSRYDDQLARRGALVATCTAERGRIEEGVRRIGGDWDAAKLATMNISELARDEIRKVQERLQKVQAQRQAVLAQLQAAKDNLQEADEDEAACRRSLEAFTQEYGEAPSVSGLQSLRDVLARYQHEQRALLETQQAEADLSRRLTELLTRFGAGLTPSQLDALLDHLSVARRFQQSLQKLDTRHDTATEQLAAMKGRTPEGRERQQIDEARGALGRCRTLLALRERRPPWAIFSAGFLLMVVLGAAAASDAQWHWLLCAGLGAGSSLVASVRALRRQDQHARELRQWATVAGLKVPVDEADLDARDLELQRRSLYFEEMEQRAIEARRLEERLAEIEAERSKLKEQWRAFVLSIGIEVDISVQAVQNLLEGTWDSGRLSAEVRQMKARCELLEARLGELRDGAEHLTDGSDTPFEVQLNRRIQQWEQALEPQKRLQEAEKKRAERQAQLAAAEKPVQDAETAVQDVASAFRTWLSEHNLPDDLSPETALRLLDRIDQVLAQLDAVSRTETELEALEAELLTFETEVVDVAARASLSFDGGETPAAQADRLVFELKQSRQHTLVRTALQNEVEQLQAQMRREEELLHTAQEQRRALLREAQAAEHATDDASIEENAKERAGCTEDELLADRANSQARLAEVSREHNACHEKRGQLSERRAQLLACDDSLELTSRRAVLVEQVRSAARDLAQKLVARRILEQAKARYDTCRQPAVVKEAERYFKAFTASEWTSLSAPLGERSILAMRSDHSVVAPQCLSRGTAEQLYLALRFGYVRQLARNALCPPILMDDILVNFDPARRTSAARAIAELAEEHQILFFTCHPDSAECLRQQTRNVTVSTLLPAGLLAEGLVAQIA